MQAPPAWQKLGQVWVASGEQPWARTHAFLPTPLLLDADRIRVFVALRDAANVGRVGFVDVDARDPRRVLRVASRPVLDVGVPGSFDESGVTPIFLLPRDGRLYLFYNGWQLGRGVRYYLFTGLAVSDDQGESFQRLSQVPILDRSDGELFVRTAPCVLADGSGLLRMWYVGGDRWIEVGGKQLPAYDLRYLESRDLRQWGRHGRVCMRPRAAPDGDEHGFGRPWIVREQDGYRMWYSVRSESLGYRLGYAESADGLRWDRRDDLAGLPPSARGWDSTMVCYAARQETPHGTYLFYNGNNYGETGFGVAVAVPGAPPSSAPT